MADKPSEAAAPPTEQLANLLLDEVTGEKVRTALPMDSLWFEPASNKY